MNIKEAKEQISNAMTAYFTKNEYGDYEIPIEKQRPIFLMGPPGIGKTAIMEQVASELGVGLVSYSMTHHTRQSALGLPFISHKTYGGKEYDISEYTMSEIIASIYDLMEVSGVKEGILFLDEINCVSETLAPSMLQFLQYKIFGRHRVPDGWIVVTAGNPPEYNNSVREFDIVTWDRLKRMDIEPDFTVWKEYAYRKGVHPSIMSYLEVKTGDFYKIESTVDGKSFVTARGWSDLSDMIRLYEKHKLPVNEMLIAQYLQNRKIAKSFAVYYDLFVKYRSDYQVPQILEGKSDESILRRAQNARFDERLALLSLLLEALNKMFREICLTETTLTDLMTALKTVKTSAGSPGSLPAMLRKQNSLLDQKLNAGKAASSLSEDAQYALHGAISILENEAALMEMTPDANFALLKNDFDKRVKALKKRSETAGEALSNAINFCESAFGNGQEVLILITELTAGYYSSRFISRYGSKEYYAHNKSLLFYERQNEIISELDELGI